MPSFFNVLIVVKMTKSTENLMQDVLETQNREKIEVHFCALHWQCKSASSTLAVSPENCKITSQAGQIDKVVNNNAWTIEDKFSLIRDQFGLQSGARNI